MKSEIIHNEVEAVRLIAETQAMLVSRANVSAKHTEMVLYEIAERLSKITPCKSFDAGIDEQLTTFVEGAVGFCEASSEEYHALWLRLVGHSSDPVVWDENTCGLGTTIGYLDARPIHLSLRATCIAGYKVIFYNATSTVVDHDMIRAFIEELAPETARSDNGLVRATDASNMTNILPSGWRDQSE